MTPDQSVPTRLVTVPDRMAAMRCLSCDHEWADLDAAVNQYPQPCPSCRSFKTEPRYEVDGTEQAKGWTW